MMQGSNLSPQAYNLLCVACDELKEQEKQQAALVAALEAAVNQIENLHTDSGWSKSGPRKADLSAVTLRVCRSALSAAKGSNA